MKSLIAALSTLALLSTSVEAACPTGFEAEPVLRAQDLVPSELLKGPRFKVDSRP